VHSTLPADASQDTLLARVHELNEDKSVHGILVQLPLPKHSNEAQVLDALDPAKDVDALTPTNVGLLLSGRAHLSPARGGRDAVVEGICGRHIRQGCAGDRPLASVGKPAAQLLLAANATVTMAHSRSRDLPGIARRADIPVAAIRQAGIW